MSISVDFHMICFYKTYEVFSLCFLRSAKHRIDVLLSIPPPSYTYKFLYVSRLLIDLHKSLFPLFHLAPW